MSNQEQSTEETDDVAIQQFPEYDYTQWQKTLWSDETVESLSTKVQQAWDKQ